MRRTVRLAYIDVAVAEGVLEKSRQSLERTRRLMDEDPGRLLQTRYASIRSNLETLAAQHYAMGSPLEDVRRLLQESLDAGWKVHELRGTGDVFPVTVVRLDLSKGEDDPARSTWTPRDPPGTKDYSLGNSWDGFEEACRAFGIGNWALGEAFARKIWDPPGARWVGPKSQVCSTHQQRLAYVFRDALAGGDSETLRPLLNVMHARPLTIGMMAEVMKGLFEGDKRGFLVALSALLHAHGAGARRGPCRTDTNLFICVPALGMSAIAVRRGLVEVGELPGKDPHLPVELFARQGAGG
jgi:hypothetical protein